MTDQPTPPDERDDLVEAELQHRRKVRDEIGRLRVQHDARLAFAAEKGGAAPPFDIGTLGEILQRPPAPPARIAGLMPWAGSTTIVAARKTGKTTFLLCLARSLLTGDPFLGALDVVPLQPGARIAFLNYEVTGETLARWADDMGIDHERLVLVNLRGRRNPLGHPGDRQHLAARLRQANVETLVVDPYSRATTQTEETNQATTAFLTDLDRFARDEVGAVDLVLAVHAGWNQERSRGASALEDWPDSIVTLTRDTEDDGDGRRFMHALGRDVDLPEDRLDFDQTTRSLRLAGAGSRKQAREGRKLDELAVLVVRAARETPGISFAKAETAIRDMDEAAQFRKGDVGKAARLAAQRGFLHIGSGPRGAAVMTVIEAPNA